MTTKQRLQKLERRAAVTQELSVQGTLVIFSEYVDMNRNIIPTSRYTCRRSDCAPVLVTMQQGETEDEFYERIQRDFAPSGAGGAILLSAILKSDSHPEQ